MGPSQPCQEESEGLRVFSDKGFRHSQGGVICVVIEPSHLDLSTGEFTDPRTAADVTPDGITRADGRVLFLSFGSDSLFGFSLGGFPILVLWLILLSIAERGVGHVGRGV